MLTQMSKRKPGWELTIHSIPKLGLALKGELWAELRNLDPHVRIGQRVGKGAPIGNTYPLLQHPSGQKECLWLVMSGSRPIVCPPWAMVSSEFTIKSGP